ncbi:hypothetical protein QE364_001479 [Nocardioides zeae]|uniref:Uncharacterized protein n=1 Tax=Nocardioides zeae TaxID=1457234 RepID=A0ACC6IGI1_9ACTN|nr:hypothetical protein [Nocardioides zeae]MDR6172769.1 hypothetical protein [Nocardioides zeae]MDR6209779.1 hypothetical protein [Nocardioides zeae]
MSTNEPVVAHRPSLRDLAWGIAVAVLAAAAWFGWMGWDDEYQVDAATNEISGPYEAWQVIGCVLTLLVLGVVAARRWRPFATAIVLSLAFTAAWSLTAAAEDETGLWGVGAVLVLVGTSVASLLVAAGVAAVGSREPR